MTVKSSRYLIVYAKRPLPGCAKTRLGKGIGTENAAGLYARLLYGYLIDLVYARLENTEIELSVASPDDVPFFSSAFPELRVHPQIDGDLGQRMAAFFAQAFDRGAASVCLLVRGSRVEHRSHAGADGGPGARAGARGRISLTVV